MNSDADLHLRHCDFSHVPRWRCPAVESLIQRIGRGRRGSSFLLLAFTKIIKGLLSVLIPGGEIKYFSCENFTSTF